MWLILLASAVCTAALHLSPDERLAGGPDNTVLILGSSVDRFAIDDTYGSPPEGTTSKSVRVIHDKEHKISVLYEFHRGTGLNGDMHPPFFISVSGKSDGQERFSTEAVITSDSPNATLKYLGTVEPDVVIVDTSLWDLATWSYFNKTYDQTSRIKRWCDHDMPGMLKLVSKTFKSSRVVFRTPPPLYPKSERHNSLTGVPIMYRECIAPRISGGKLFGQYEVLDYYKIMQDMMDSSKNANSLKALWRPDTYHPGPKAGRAYIQAIRALFPNSARLRPTAPVDVNDDIQDGTERRTDDDDDGLVVD